MFSFLYQTSRVVRRNFILDFWAAVFFGLFFGGLNSFLLVQARRIGATSFEVGLLAALPNIWMLLSPVWGKLFEKQCPFRGVLLADGLSRIVLIFLVFDKSAHWYLLVFTFHYFFTSISATIYGKAMRQAYNPELRGTIMGWVRVGSALAQMISTAVAGILLPLIGVQPLFAILAVFGILSSLTFGRMKQAIFESPVETNKKTAPFKVFQNDTQFRRYMMALFLFGLATAISLPAYPLYQVDVLKVSNDFISFFSIIISFSALIFYLFGGQLIDRYSPIKLSMVIFIINIVIPILYFLSNNQWPLLSVALLQGIVNAGIDLVAINSVLCMAKEGEIYSYMGVHLSLLGIRGTIGPLLAPLFIQMLQYKGFFLLVLVLNLIGIWVLWPLIRRKECTTSGLSATVS